MLSFKCPGLVTPLAALAVLAVTPVYAQEKPDATGELETMIVTSTREETPLERSPATVSVITSEELQRRQITHVAEALRSVPGLDVVQTGSPGQLTSVFTRGVTSEGTQVMIDGLPVNQGLAGLFNFADLSTENIDRIEVVRGPQSSIYGPRASGGVINIITKTGGDKPLTELNAEGGSFGTGRESATTGGKLGDVDYFASFSRLDTDNERPNNQYRYTAGTLKLGWTPVKDLHLSVLGAYSLADTGNPNAITAPRPLDNLLTERWMVAPRIEWQAAPWWKHTLIAEYDHERQVNSPNDDGFLFDTRGLFKRWQVDYQTEIDATSWFNILAGYFYSRVEAEQERPFVLFGDTLIGDKTENQAGFLQLTFMPTEELTVVASGRFDHFSQSGDVGTWRAAANYVASDFGTIFHGSVATGFSPATSQDKIFGNNFDLDPNETWGVDFGVEQPLFDGRLLLGATWFYNEASNIVGFDGSFNTLNLGSARMQGVETTVVWTPLPDLNVAVEYTYLDTEKTSSEDISQPEGARLPRRPRHHLHASVSYLWFGKLRTGLEVDQVAGREELRFGERNFDIEDYAVFRLTAEYAVTEHFHVTGRIENLFDEDYAEVFGYPNLGRGYYGGVRLRF
ncbi:MAG TPA: TonB-dependent receptor [Chthoniobacterales bacterium]